jgi:hypothetical protein
MLAGCISPVATEDESTKLGKELEHTTKLKEELKAVRVHARHVEVETAAATKLEEELKVMRSRPQ